MKNKLHILTLISLLPFSSSVLSQDSNMYIGVGVGSTGIDTKVTDELPVPLSIKPDDNSLLVKGGYVFNPNVSVDIAYQNYGDIKFTTPLSSNVYSWEPRSLSLNVNLSYPIANIVSPFISAGLGYIALNENQKAINDDTGSSIRYGAGIELIASQIHPVTIVVGYSAEMFTLEDEKKEHDVTLDSYYVSVNYKF